MKAHLYLYYCTVPCIWFY